MITSTLLIGVLTPTYGCFCGGLHFMAADEVVNSEESGRKTHF